MDVVISSTVTEFAWNNGTPPRLRIYADIPFLTAAEVPVHQGNPFGTGRAYRDYPTTLDGSNRVVAPAVTLPSTTDSSRPDAKPYRAYLYSRGADQGHQYQEFSVFGAGFAVDHTDLTQTWEQVRTFNEDAITASGDLSVPGDVTVGDDLIVGDDLHVIGDLTVDGTSTFAGLVIGDVTIGDDGVITDDLMVGDDLTVGGDANISGNATALNYFGNASFMTGGVGSASVGHASTGSVTLQADSDNNGTGLLDEMTGPDVSRRMSNDGTQEFFYSTKGPFYDKGGQVYNVFAYGIVGAAHGGSPSDESAAWAVLLGIVYAAGGGTIVFNSRLYRFDSKWTIPNDATGVPKQPAMRIIGQGASHSGQGSVPSGGTIIDLRSTASPAKIDTRGLGFLEITGITFKDGSASSAAFLQTTNTTLLVHANEFYGNKAGWLADQDAIILGGTTTDLDGDADAAFQGYGTIIEGNYFNYIRRGVLLRSYANGVVIRDNIGWTNNGGECFIEVAGFDAGNTDSGAWISGNLVEVNSYNYAVKLTHAVHINCIGNNFYDQGGTQLNGAVDASVTTFTVDSTTLFPSTGSFRVDSEIISYTGKTGTTFTGITRGTKGTTAASHLDNAPVLIALAGVYCSTGAQFNYIRDGFHIDSIPGLLEDAAVLNQNDYDTMHQSVTSNKTQPQQFSGPVRVRNGAVGLELYDSTNTALHNLQGSNNTLIFNVTPSGGSAESTLHIGRDSATAKRMTLQGSTVNIYTGAAGSDTKHLSPTGTTAWYGITSELLISALGSKFNVGIDGNGSGLKHLRVTTGSVGAGATVDVTCSWAVAFANANYTLQHPVVVEATGSLEVIGVKSISASQVVVTIKNNDGGSARTGTIHLAAMHD